MADADAGGRASARAASPTEISLHAFRKLRLNQLQIIETILQTGSFALAAQQLGMTQSAVTKAVQELERFLDGRLFVRSNRGVQPTELGQRLETHLRTILSEVRHMAESLNALRVGDGGTLSIGVLATATSGVLAEAVRTLHKRHPRIRLRVLVGDRSQLHGYLLDGRIDLVYGNMPPAHAAHMEQLRAEALYEESLVVMAGQHHPLARKRKVTLQDLLGYPLIVPPAESVVRRHVEQLFEQAGLSLPQDCIDSLAPLLNIGLMGDQATVAFMASGLARLLQPATALVTLKTTLPVSFGDVGYVLRAGREPSFAWARLVECLLESATRSGPAPGR